MSFCVGGNEVCGGRGGGSKIRVKAVHVCGSGKWVVGLRRREEWESSRWDERAANGWDSWVRGTDESTLESVKENFSPPAELCVR